MTQQNKGVVSKIFYNIRKNRVPYLEIKLKPPKNLQFDPLVVVVKVVVAKVVVAEQKKEEKDKQNTRNKKKQGTKTD